MICHIYNPGASYLCRLSIWLTRQKPLYHPLWYHDAICVIELVQHGFGAGLCLIAPRHSLSHLIARISQWFRYALWIPGDEHWHESQPYIVCYLKQYSKSLGLLNLPSRPTQGMGLLRKIAGCIWAGNAGNLFPAHHGLAIPTWKRSRHSQSMRNPQFYVSVKRLMVLLWWRYCQLLTLMGFA